jgi:Iron/manganese superoxide dismutases, alpha-hairpin domain
MPFTLPPLPYDYKALEPHIDEQTMRIHHDKHHAAYVNNLNAALEPHPDLQQKSIEELLAGVDRLPEAIKAPVRNNGGGHANHTMFWELMAPGGAKEPDGELAQAINSSFGGLSQWLGLARGRSGWQAEHREHPQSGHAAHDRQDSGARLRRVGACVLPQVPESPARLCDGLVERGQLDRRGPPVREGAGPRKGYAVRG